MFRKMYDTKLGLLSLRSLLQSRSERIGGGSAWTKTKLPSEISRTNHSMYSMQRPLQDEEQAGCELSRFREPKTRGLRAASVSVEVW